MASIHITHLNIVVLLLENSMFDDRRRGAEAPRGSPCLTTAVGGAGAREPLPINSCDSVKVTRTVRWM
jgi:hypothetical protein